MASSKKKQPATPRRPMIPIEASPEVEKIIEDGRTEIGMSRKVFVEKVLKWFAAQDDVTRATILETIPESLRADVAKLALEKAAQKKKGGQQ